MNHRTVTRPISLTETESETISVVKIKHLTTYLTAVCIVSNRLRRHEFSNSISVKRCTIDYIIDRQCCGKNWQHVSDWRPLWSAAVDDCQRWGDTYPAHHTMVGHNLLR